MKYINDGGNIRATKRFPKRMTWKKALELSIEGWGFAYREVSEGRHVIDKNDCALCDRSNRLNLTSCGNCPVAKAVGEDGCWNTPYGDVEFDEPKTVKAELGFLKSLRKE